MSKLFITEKATLARAIAGVLPLPRTSHEGYLSCGDDVVITWCFGHLLEQAEPERYDTEYRHWRLDALPIIPQQWQLVPRERGRQQLDIIEQLLAGAEQVVHAGAPDREGQLMIDEILHYLENSKPVQRLLLNDLNPDAIRRALAALADNHDFRHLSTSALARTRADWLYGLNMTRAYTLLGHRSGYEGVLSVGRVQTPVLGMVVERDATIEHFRPHTYYEVQVDIEMADNSSLACKARWLPADPSLLLDDEGRVLDNKVCAYVVDHVLNKPGVVISKTLQQKSLPPPLPYNLSALQIDAARQHGYSALDVLQACQSLYEKHRLITYPRPGSRFLPLDLFDEVNPILDAIAFNERSLAKAVAAADSWERNAAWDDSRCGSCHAIIPTAIQVENPGLTEMESALYRMICRQFLAQFYSPFRYEDAVACFEVNSFRFEATGRYLLGSGWKVLYGEAEEALSSALPPFREGDSVFCFAAETRKVATRPPRRFTDASLMEAMTSIRQHIRNPAVAARLDDNDAIGTDATRARIIHNLLERGFLVKGNKTLISTRTGRDLVAALPSAAVTPDATALSEKALKAMAAGREDYHVFMKAMEEQVTALVDEARHQARIEIHTADETLGLVSSERYWCPACKSALLRKSASGRFFWGCSAYPSCKLSLPDREGKPVFDRHDTPRKVKSEQRILEGRVCPDCGKPLARRKGRHGWFAGCTAYPDCTYTGKLET